MAVKLFDMFGLFRIEDQGSKEISKIGKSAVDLGEKFTKGIAKAAKWGAGIALAGGTAAAAFSAKALQLGADTEEMLNKYNVVFDGMTKTVDSWANEFADRVGRSRFQTQEFLGNLGDLTQGLGLTKQASFDLATSVVELGTDLASFNNVNDAQAIEAVSKAMLGEAESAKQLGLLLNVERVKDYAEAQGLVYDELTDAEKAQQVLNLAMKQSKNAIGDAERSAGSYTNQMKRFKDGLTDVTKEFGMKLLPSATKFVNFLNKTGIPAFEKFLDVFSKVWTKSKEVFKDSSVFILRTLADLLRGFDGFLKSNEKVLNSVWKNTKKIMGWIGSFIKASWGFIVEVWEENSETIKEIWDDTLTLIKDAFEFWKDAFERLWSRFGDDIKAIWRNMWEDIKSLLGFQITIITNIIGGLINLITFDFEGLKKNVTNIIDSMTKTVTDIFGRWWSLLGPKFLEIKSNIFNFFIELKNDMFNYGENIVEGLTEGMTSKFNSAKDTVMNLANGIADTFTNFFDIRSPSRKMKGYGENIVEGVNEGIDSKEDSSLVKVADWMDNLADKIENSGVVEEAVKTGENVSEGIAEGVKKGWPSLSEAWDKTKKFFKENWEDLLELGTAITDKLGGVWSEGMNAISIGSEIAAEAVSGNWIGAATIAVTKSDELIRSVGKVFGFGKKGARETSKAAAKAWNDAIDSVDERLKDFATTTKSVIVGSLDNAIKSSKEVVVKFSSDVVDRVGYVITRTATRMENFSDSILKNVKGAYNSLSEEISSSLINISENTDDSFTAVSKSIRTVITSLSRNFRKVEKDLVDTSANVSEEVKKSNEETWETFVDTIEATVDEVKPLLNELLGIAISDTDKLANATIEAIEKQLDALEENEIRALETNTNLTADALDERIRLVEEKYQALREAEALEAEAARLITAQNNDELVKLLDSYNPLWQDAGRSLGEKLVEGLITGREETGEIVGGIVGQITEAQQLQQLLARQEATIGIAGSQINTGVSGAVTGNQVNEVLQRGQTTSGGITQTVVINSPTALDPQETARLLKLASQTQVSGVLG